MKNIALNLNKTLIPRLASWVKQLLENSDYVSLDNLSYFTTIQLEEFSALVGNTI